MYVKFNRFWCHQHGCNNVSLISSLCVRLKTDYRPTLQHTLWRPLVILAPALPAASSPYKQEHSVPIYFCVRPPTLLLLDLTGFPCVSAQFLYRPASLSIYLIIDPDSCSLSPHTVRLVLITGLQITARQRCIA